MSATYNELLLTDTDRARALLGDTDVSDAANALLTNEHIVAVLAEQGSLPAAVAWLADELIVRYGQEPDSVRLPSGLSVSFRDRIAAWSALATRMRKAAAILDAQNGASVLSFVPARYGGADSPTDEYGR